MTTFIQSADELKRPFVAALMQNRLMVQKCKDCENLTMYPKYRCPACFSANMGWAIAGGGGQLLTFTILRAGAPSAFEVEPPYGIGVVRLDEGPQLMGRLYPGEDGTWDHYRCDMRVEFRSPQGTAEIAERPAAWFLAAE